MFVDDDLRKGYTVSILDKEQMSNWCWVEHQPLNPRMVVVGFFVFPNFPVVIYIWLPLGQQYFGRD